MLRTKASFVPFVFSTTLLCALLSACTSVASNNKPVESLEQKLTAEQLIESLNLNGHVEGGFFAKRLKQIIGR